MKKKTLNIFINIRLLRNQCNLQGSIILKWLIFLHKIKSSYRLVIHRLNYKSVLIFLFKYTLFVANIFLYMIRLSFNLINKGIILILREKDFNFLYRELAQVKRFSQCSQNFLRTSNFCYLLICFNPLSWQASHLFLQYEILSLFWCFFRQ